LNPFFLIQIIISFFKANVNLKMLFIINSFMKDSREYTNKDPLVKAAYDVIAAKKALEAAEAAAKLEETNEATELEEGLGFADSSQGAKQAYKNTLSLSKSLKKGSSLNKAVNKRLEGKYDSDFVKMEDAIELILSTLDEIDREYQMNEGTDVAEWKEKSLWAEGALSLPNEKELAMAITQLNFLCHASMEIRNHLMNGGGFPEWFQNKLSGLHNSMEDLHSYMAGKEAGEEEA
jgi:hypothetical protein